MKITFNFYIKFLICILNLWPYNLGVGFAEGNCLFEAVRLTDNDDEEKYEYSGYDYFWHR